MKKRNVIKKGNKWTVWKKTWNVIKKERNEHVEKKWNVIKKKEMNILKKNEMLFTTQRKKWKQ